jgi:acylphosphatase
VILMPRKRLIITGNVQRVSYRAYVLQCASIMGVAGTVKNLPDGTVEVYCEADEKTLKKFLTALAVHGDAKNPFEMDVKKIDIFTEKDKAYRLGKPPRSFDRFVIDYCRKVSPAQRESLEREEFTLVAGQNIAKGLGKIDQRLENIDRGLEKGFPTIDQKMDNLDDKMDTAGHNVKDMHKDMNERFEELDNKYHVISEALLAHTKAIEALVEDYIAEKKRKDQNKGQT